MPLMLTVAYVGNFRPPESTENHVREALGNLGHSVRPLQEDGIDWDDLPRLVDGADLMLWTRTWTLDHDAQRRGLAGVEVPTVGFHLDRWWGLRREHLVREEPFFTDTDWMFTADGGHDEQWESIGVRHVWSPPAILARHAVTGTAYPKWRSRVAFVGNWQRYHPDWPHRKQLVMMLRRWYGKQGFKAWPLPNQQRITGVDLSDLYASTDVAVGDSCLVGGVARYWSDRVPETLGRGGFLIHPQVEGLADHWPDLPTWPIGDWPALHALIEKALRDPEWRDMVQRRGRSHAIEWHTYERRLAHLVSVVL
jgi:hypothetical protein